MNEDHLSIIKPFFDLDFYVKTYPDVTTANFDPLAHYLYFGWKEGRNPCPWFSTTYYLENNLDVQESQINPFVHYILYGKIEGRPCLPSEASSPAESIPVQEDHATQPPQHHDIISISSTQPSIDPITSTTTPAVAETTLEEKPVPPMAADNPPPHKEISLLKTITPSDLRELLFDEKHYINQGFDPLLSDMTALQHYVQNGWKEGKNPCAWFSVNIYLKAYPDIAKAGIDPFLHFLEFGRFEGRNSFLKAGVPAPQRAAPPDVPAINKYSDYFQLKSVGKNIYLDNKLKTDQ